MCKYLTILIFSLYFCNLQSQKFTIYDKETDEKLEFVNCIYFVGGRAIDLQRSNFDGVVEFKKTQFLDSVIFQLLGYERFTVSHDNYTVKVYLKPKKNLLQEVLITGQIVPGNKYQSPFKMRYYTESEIENKNSVNLADFLSTENNFNISQDPIFGTKVTLNGMSGSDLKLMIDGIPVAGRIDGNIDYSQILLENIGKIEVVDAPLSTIYGTNATGGVINLITKTGKLNKSSVTANLYGESVGVLNANAYYNTTKNGNKISLGIHRNVFFGWDPNSDSLNRNVKPIWRDKAWNPKEQLLINTSFFAPLTKKTKLHLKVNGMWENIINKLNPASQFSTTVYDEYYNTNRFNIGGNTTTLFSKSDKWHNYANVNFFRRTIKNLSQNLTEGTIDELDSKEDEIVNLFYRSQVTHEWPKEKVSVLYGFDFNMDIGSSERFSENIKPLYDIGLFSMLNVKFSDKFLMQPGLRYSINNQVSIPMYGTLNFRYNIIKHLSSRFSVSRGYKIPDIKELYFEFIDINHNIAGNEKLREELNTNVQIGFDVVPDKKKMSETLMSYSSSFNYSYFHKEDAIDLINTNVNNNRFQYLNIGDVKGQIFSLDNSLKYKQTNFTFGFSLSGLSKEFDDDEITNSETGYLYNWTSNANFTHQFKKIGLGVSLINKFYSTREFIVLNNSSSSTEVSEMPHYIISDVSFSKNTFEEKLNVRFGVKNIFDIQNLRVIGSTGAVHQSNSNNEISQLWGRTLFINLALKIDTK